MWINDLVLFFIFKLSNPESTCVTLGFEFASKPVYIAYLFAEWASIDYVADILYIEASWWSGEHKSYCKGNFGIKILYKQPFVNLFEVSRLLTPYNGRRRTVKPLKFLYINLVVLFFSILLFTFCTIASYLRKFSFLLKYTSVPKVMLWMLLVDLVLITNTCVSILGFDTFPTLYSSNP